MTKETAASQGTTGPQVRVNTITTNVRRRNQRTPGCWMQSPATLLGFKATQWALVDTARERNLNISEVTKVRTAIVDGEQRIWIYPTLDTDPDGIEIKQYKRGSGPAINLYNFLAQENLLIPVGRAQRFDLVPMDRPESPVGPALLLDFTKVLEDKPLPKRKSKAKAKTGQPEAK